MSSRDDALVEQVVQRWRQALERQRRGGMSLPGEQAGLATGSNGRGCYRLTLEDAARLAVAVAAGFEAARFPMTSR